ncbi:MAG: hypothetical protein WCS86_02165 [Candidatus Paceibacterota bacterium]
MASLFDSFFNKQTFCFILESTQKIFHVHSGLREFFPTKEQGGKIDEIGPNIMKWFGNVCVLGRLSETKLFMYQFLKNLISHREVLQTSEKFQIYEEFDLFDAFELGSKLINDNKIKLLPGTCVVIYLKEEHFGKKCGLFVFCDDEGKIIVDTREINHDALLTFGSSALFIR